MKKIIKKGNTVSLVTAIESHQPVGVTNTLGASYIFISTPHRTGHGGEYVCFSKDAVVTAWSIMSVKQMKDCLQEWERYLFETIGEAFAWLNQGELE